MKYDGSRRWHQSNLEKRGEGMKYRILCVDLDGTILNGHHELDQRHRKVLKEVEERGILTIIATGRVHEDALSYARRIGLHSPIISSNGALIVDQAMDEVIYRKHIERNHLWTVLNHARKERVHSNLVTSDCIYTDSLLERLFWMVAKWRGFMSRGVRFRFLPTRKAFLRKLAEHEDAVMKCELFSRNPAAVLRVQKVLSSLRELELAGTTDGNLEITGDGVSKGEALRIIAEKFGVRREEILAVGDSENDRAMLEYAGLGIVMGNASESMKAVADYVTGTNDEQGAAAAIERFLLAGA